MPASPVGADLVLRRERSFGNLAVDGGPRQAGPGKDGFQPDDTFWLAHGRAASCWLRLTASETRQKERSQAVNSLFGSSHSGAEPAVNRMVQISIPLLRPRPRSMPWLKASSRLSRRPDSKTMPSSLLRLARSDSSCGSRSRLLAISPIAERADL